MNLALFDLDNTLIAGDSDHLWGEFLVKNGFVDAQTHSAQNDQFYQDYKNRCLDIHAYLRFALQPLTRFKPEQLIKMHQTFMEEFIEPIVLPKALDLVDKHRQQGDTLVIITATNSFITAPIAQRFGIEHLIASEGERLDGRYTGEPEGIPCYQSGKIEKLRLWLEGQSADFVQRYFYSDSANDIPLLNDVDHPVAVDPDEALQHHALTHNIPIISLR